MEGEGSLVVTSPFYMETDIAEQVPWKTLLKKMTADIQNFPRNILNPPPRVVRKLLSYYVNNINSYIFDFIFYYYSMRLMLCLFCFVFLMFCL